MSYRGKQLIQAEIRKLRYKAEQKRREADRLDKEANELEEEKNESGYNSTG